MSHIHFNLLTITMTTYLPHYHLNTIPLLNTLLTILTTHLLLTVLAIHFPLTIHLLNTPLGTHPPYTLYPTLSILNTHLLLTTPNTHINTPHTTISTHLTPQYPHSYTILNTRLKTPTTNLLNTLLSILNTHFLHHTHIILTGL